VNEPVRVLLLEMPRLLRDILAQAVQGHGDCELVKDVRRSRPACGGQPVSPDVVILGLTAVEDATLVAALLARWPCARVVTLMPADEDVTAYELRPERRALGRLSPLEIVDSCHDAIRRTREMADESIEE
jgi:hypothetical protein